MAKYYETALLLGEKYIRENIIRQIWHILYRNFYIFRKIAVLFCRLYCFIMPRCGGTGLEYRVKECYTEKSENKSNLEE